MKTLFAIPLLAAASLIGVSAAAHAQGGASINQAPPESIVGNLPTRDTGSEQSPSFDGRTIYTWNSQAVPAEGNEASVQTANSMPPGAENPNFPRASAQMAPPVAMTSGHLAPNNGSGIPQTFASMPAGAAEGTVPMMSSRSVARYMAAQEKRQLGYALQQNLPGVTAPHG